MTDLAQALGAAGVIVVQYPGWRDRGVTRRATGSRYPFEPFGILVHDDIIGPGDPAGIARVLAEKGRPDLRAPLYNAWVDREGVWWLLAAGNANHAGRGDQRALDLIAYDHAPVKGTNTRSDAVGNTHLLGVCMAHHPDHDGPDHARPQLDSLVRGLAAICTAEGWTSDRVWRHAEFTDRKPDARISGPWLRAAINALTEDDMTPEEHGWLARVHHEVAGGDTKASTVTQMLEQILTRLSAIEAKVKG